MIPIHYGITFSEEGKTQANKYFRFLMEAKLHNHVAVLLDDHYSECINMLMELRKLVKIKDDNPYSYPITLKYIISFSFLLQKFYKFMFI